ncbi:MAG: hypothetical protein J2P57_04400, partial [Acidimicrobiaceae bacterium]|nr:hypothetical protein [Acidimicrobiaceae bacterium]
MDHSVNGDQERELPGPHEPMAAARAFAADHWTHPNGALLLRNWRGGWWRWETTHWAEVEHRAVREAAYRYTERAYFIMETKQGPVAVRWLPNRHKISDLLEALAAVVYLDEKTVQPSWTDGVEHEGMIVACANGLVDVETRRLETHDPRYFNQTSVAFAYDPDAGDPVRWERFLEDLWGDDTESIEALKQWMGYIVSGRLDLDTIFLMVGPTRAGKGAI